MMVSVNIPAYNHEKYIVLAVNSALMQKTNFDYEVLIGEDDSTDNTKQLVIDLAKKHPDKIKLFFNDGKPKAVINGRKLGMFNFIKLLKNAKGKYIAILDGDDYWTDSNKLQKQVDFMEAHPECSMTFHDSFILDEKTNTTTEYKFDNHVLDFDYVAECGNVCVTCSIVMRNYFKNLEPGWDSKYKIDHDTLHFLSLMNGTLNHIDGIMGVYRISGAGIWTSVSTQKQILWVISDLKIYLKQFDKRFHFGLRKQLSRREYYLSLLYLNERNLILFLKFQSYAMINSFRAIGFKGPFGLLKHTIKYLLGLIPQKK
jgi:glycosyltransferase involved in cell wall biosynthesis